MEIDSPVDLLVADLDMAIAILGEAGETSWQRVLHQRRDQISSGDMGGLEPLFRAINGNGIIDALRLAQSSSNQTPKQRERGESRLWDLRESIWRRCRVLQMFRSQFKILKVKSPKDGGVVWTPDRLRKRLIEGQYEGLDLMGCDIPLEDLAFLTDFQQLRVLSVQTRVKEDLDAFALTGLRELVLLTGCRNPVPECELPLLHRLVLVERAGIESRKWPALEEFLLGVWRSDGVAFLAGGEQLRDVELQGKNQNVSLAGIETCERLESFDASQAAVDDLRPLRGLTNLRELKLVSRTNQHGSLDLSDIASPALEKLWIGGASELHNLSCLTEFPVLQELRLVDSPLTDADLALLESMADRVQIDLVKGGSAITLQA